MSDKRLVEVFTAGCGICEDTVKIVEEMACSCCDVKVLSTQEETSLERARELGVVRVPAIAINGQLLECCAKGIDTNALRSAGLGQPLN